MGNLNTSDTGDSEKTCGNCNFIGNKDVVLPGERDRYKTSSWTKIHFCQNAQNKVLKEVGIIFSKWEIKPMITKPSNDACQYWMKKA